MTNVRAHVGIETVYCLDCDALTAEECICDDLNFAETCPDCGCDCDANTDHRQRGCHCACHNEY